MVIAFEARRQVFAHRFVEQMADRRLISTRTRSTYSSIAWLRLGARAITTELSMEGGLCARVNSVEMPPHDAETR